MGLYYEYGKKVAIWAETRKNPKWFYDTKNKKAAPENRCGL